MDQRMTIVPHPLCAQEGNSHQYRDLLEEILSLCREIEENTRPRPRKRGTTDRGVKWSRESGFTGIDLERLLGGYPGVDVPGEVRKMNLWLLSNPTRARKRDWGRFVNGWLSRAADQLPRQDAPPRPSELLG